MTFESHFNKISRKMFSTIIYINTVKDNFSKSAGVVVIQSLVLSIIDYGIKVRDTTNNTLMHQIQKLQNFAAKAAVGGAAKHEHGAPFLRELGWLKIKQKHMFEMGTLMFSVTRGSSLNSSFHVPLVSEVFTAATRQHQLYVPVNNACTGARSMLVAGHTLWNSLPSDIRNAPSLRSFKKQLFLHLFKHQFSE